MTYPSEEEILIPDAGVLSGGTELRVQRKNTRAYIAASPDDITFMRGTRERDGAGGWRTSSRTPLPASQTVRIIQAEEARDVERRNSDGKIVQPTLNLLAEYDADIAVGDTFDWRGMSCEVVYITDLKYELTCEVAVK